MLILSQLYIRFILRYLILINMDNSEVRDLYRGIYGKIREMKDISEIVERWKKIGIISDGLSDEAVENIAASYEMVAAYIIMNREEIFENKDIEDTATVMVFPIIMIVSKTINDMVYPTDVMTPLINFLERIDIKKFFKIKNVCGRDFDFEAEMTCFLAKEIICKMIDNGEYTLTKNINKD